MFLLLGGPVFAQKPAALLPAAEAVADSVAYADDEEELEADSLTSVAAADSIVDVVEAVALPAASKASDAASAPQTPAPEVPAPEAPIAEVPIAEVSAPEAPTLVSAALPVAERAALLHSLTAALHLQDAQIMGLRRALASAVPEPAAPLLTDAQRLRLAQWAAQQPPAVQASVAGLR